MLQFLLNNDLIQLDDFRSDQTLLEFLREDRRLTGTKEGCASGDCGACTVTVAELVEDQLHYYTINSCITFLGSLHGRQVITVEHLDDQDNLHPVQQAMVECHGSQCGFCTPGFVMSLFTLYKNTTGASRHQVETAIAGNLCRCTGYRPIIDAALQACASPQADHIEATKENIIRSLKQIASSKTNGSSKQGGFVFAHSLEHLSEVLTNNPSSRIVCGSTDLALEVTQQLKSLPDLVYLGGVPELNRIEKTDDVIRIGAAVRYSLCEKILMDEYPDLEELLARLGSKPIRNQGSIGGNIANASPIGDMPPVLIALGSHILLRKGDCCREILVEDYFIDYKQTVLEPGEFIQEIIIPRAKPGQQLKIYKNSKRFDDDISTALGVFNLIVDGNNVEFASVAFGGMAAVPKRAYHCEKELSGNVLSETIISKAKESLCKDFQPIGDVRASAAYRNRIAIGMLDRLFAQLADREKQSRVDSRPVLQS